MFYGPETQLTFMNTKRNKGLWLKDSDSRTLTERLWLKDSDSRTLTWRLWLKDSDSRILTQGLWLKDSDSRILTQGLWLKDSDSRTLTKGLWLKDSDSRILTQGLWLKDSALTTLTQRSFGGRDFGIILASESEWLMEYGNKTVWNKQIITFLRKYPILALFSRLSYIELNGLAEGVRRIFEITPVTSSCCRLYTIIGHSRSRVITSST